MINQLIIKNLFAGYSEEPVLESINLSINPGDFLGVLGPNGSGKTTLVRTLTRSLKPLSGEVLIDNEDIYKTSAKNFAKKIALMSQDIWYSFDYKVIEVVLMGRYVHLNRFSVEGPKDIEIAKSALEDVGMLEKSERFMGTLSGGERQRVMLARAVAQQSKILILDEPTSHLDINYAIDIMKLVTRLSKENNLTVIAVMHDINLAAQYCNRIILLGNRHILAEGNCKDVITSENIKKVYKADVLVENHPVTDRPFIIPK